MKGRYRIDINRESIFFSCIIVIAFIIAFLLNEYNYERVSIHIRLMGHQVSLYYGDLPLIERVHRRVLVFATFFIILIGYIIVRIMMIFSNNNLLPPRSDKGKC